MVTHPFDLTGVVVKYPDVIQHSYTVDQARILLDILKYHSGETLRPAFHNTEFQRIDEALDKLRHELSEYIATDDGLGFIIPSRDDKGLI